MSEQTRNILIDVGFSKYGNDDKAHAGAIFLSLLLLAVLLAAVLVAAISPHEEVLKIAIQGLSSTFSLVAGVAIGRSGAVNRSHGYEAE